MTAEELAQGLLNLCEEKIRQNRQPIVTWEDVAGLLRSLLGITEPEMARPKPIPQQPLPDVPPGTYVPGLGVYTGQGSTAQAFDSLANPLQGEE